MGLPQLQFLPDLELARMMRPLVGALEQVMQQYLGVTLRGTRPDA
jgi:hypothetical protein